MKQVVQSARSGKLSLREAPEPKVRAGCLLVRTQSSLISAGTERSVVSFARKSLAGKAKERPDLVKKVLAKARRDGIGAAVAAVRARLDEPLPLGYSAAGEVIEVGAGLEGLFFPGQRVAIAGAGFANHAEINVVPRNLAAVIPDGVPDDEACFATMGAIALHATRNLNPGLGDVTAVIGVGLLGQLSVQLLALSGVRVVALDYLPGRLELARQCGAEAVFNLNDGGPEAAISALTGGLGCDSVLIAAATKSNEPLETAAAIARDRAVVCLAGMTGTTIPFREFMKKELNIVVSRSYGPGRYDADYEKRGVKYPEGWVRWTETENMVECLRLMSLKPPRRLDVGKLITHRFDLEEAEAAYALVTDSDEPHLGVVLTYEDKAPSNPRPAFAAPKVKRVGGCVLGVIGAGNFAKAVLLPELKKLDNVTLHTIVTRHGPSAGQTGDAFGFAHAAADESAVLDNKDINAVLIATRHDSHAELTARALKAGKAVLVEKPLGLNREEIAGIVEARNGSNAFFQVGFNRRFAPMSIEAHDHLAGMRGPKFVLLRVNAGGLPADSWINDGEEGGGRILGEVCHFVDLARFLVASPIVSLQATATAAVSGGCEDLSATLRFADGSLATVVYTGLGDDAMGKELIEAYAGGSVITIDNFRSLSVAGNGKVSVGKRKSQDKGFKAALKAFTAASAAGGPAPTDEAELIETSIATIAVLESLRTGGRIDL
ncbi:MAG: theronine dehydrogenase [Rhodospirillales bacterium RIFCSPLOWO2_12_FULL_58_28]|nr:MAG: theronine dehydrogenase [Rhodospirillales bacterium RIFCSPLOWO2_02_FULL_58_16]OHC77919.1 MAG: theronine dehydrogenase [Rhodospirillales bacterium RIFCSPLOWO2_12_FULL_58_28]